jgi:SAM-dependent methyltransferase
MLKTCRSCGCNRLLPIISFGNLPLANSFLTADQLKDEPECLYPLDLVLCPGCSLVQITETVSPGMLFRNYLYLSSSSERVLQNSKELVDKIIGMRRLMGESLVIEIASNDGYLLKNYVERGIPVLGIEPAINVARIAEENGIHTKAEFFCLELAEALYVEGYRADVIHANNVIAHVAGLHSVVEGMATLLKPDGVVIVENHYVRDLIEHVEFDSIYHEHLCYYSATSLRWIFEQHGFVMVDIERIPIHGGSIRAYFQKQSGPLSLQIAGAARVIAEFDNERIWVEDRNYYRRFGSLIGNLRVELLELLRQMKAAGRTIAGYGASAKSTTLLNYFGIGAETLDFIVDNIPLKQGRYTPGTHLPIYDPGKLLEKQPDYVLILAWNFADDIILKEAEYQARGGKFIVPIPKLYWDL